MRAANAVNLNAYGKFAFKFAVFMLAALAVAAPVFAQGPAPREEQLSAHQKSIRWARPALSVSEIDGIIEEVELNASRYGLDMDFAVAFISAEMSLYPAQAYTRQWSSVMELKRVYAYDKVDAPAVWDDLPNAISTMRMSVDDTSKLTAYIDRTLKNAVTRYWAGPAKSQNRDSIDRFYTVFREKYKAILIASDKGGELERGGMPITHDEISGFSSKLPRMEQLDRQLRSYNYEGAYVDAIRQFNKRLDERTALLIARSILTFSNQTGIDARLVVALIHCESAFNPRATSPKGAMGLGQLMPATAKSFGIRDPYEPVQNVWVCVRYLEREFYRFEGRRDALDLVLAAYNAGPGAVKKYGGVPPYKETQNYVRKVKSLYAKLSA